MNFLAENAIWSDKFTSLYSEQYGTALNYTKKVEK